MFALNIMRYNSIEMGVASKIHNGRQTGGRFQLDLRLVAYSPYKEGAIFLF